MTTQNQVTKTTGDIILMDIENTQKMCHALMKTVHYSKLGEVGIFAVVQKAKTLNIDPLDALNGGLYCVNGKVEMSAQMMSQLIRQAGHSFTKDRRSDDTICILHGKRKDNEDTWTESFSINDAKRAGIYKENSPWGKFPRNMLYARALSNLARQLFSDVIKGCYVEGEISQAHPINEQVKNEDITEQVAERKIITKEQYEELNDLIGEDHEYKNSVLRFIATKFKATGLQELPSSLYEKVKAKALSNIKNREEIITDNEIVADKEAL